MKYKTNLHTHTIYCSGNASVDEMCAAAIMKGFSSIGFSEQIYIDFDKDNSMPVCDTKSYINEVLSVKKELCGDLDVFLGCEYDYFSSGVDLSDFEYIIGAVHYVEKDGVIICADEEEHSVVRFVNEHFGGDFYKYCKAYYEYVAKLCDKVDFDIIAHFDLVTKYNDGGKYFDETSSKYMIPALEAAEHLIKKGKLFEINTSGLYRGGRKRMSPGKMLLATIKNFGGNVVISSDSHDIKSLGYKFGEALEFAKECNFKSVKYFSNDGFLDFPII